MRLLNIPLIFISSIALLTGCAVKNGNDGSVKTTHNERNLAAVILFEEKYNDSIRSPGYTVCENAIAQKLAKKKIYAVKKELAATSAKTTGINISESLKGIIDPVIKDYLLGELKLDILILGVITIETDSAANKVKYEFLIRSVSLKTGRVLNQLHCVGLLISTDETSIVDTITDEIMVRGFAEKTLAQYTTEG